MVVYCWRYTLNVYILNIGGDYQLGRFYSTSVIACVAIIATLSNRINLNYIIYGLTFIAFVFSFSATHSVLKSGLRYGGNDPDTKFTYGPDMIATERTHWYQGTGLPKVNHSGNIDHHFADWSYEQEYISKKTGDMLFNIGAVGLPAFFIDRDIHIFDYNALGDPLLARLPASYQSDLRAGHYRRHIPRGYLESVKTNKNLIKNAELKQYYEKLKLVVSGNLLDPERLKTIIGFLFGTYNHLINSYVENTDLVNYAHLKYKNGELHLDLSKLNSKVGKTTPSWHGTLVHFTRQQHQLFLTSDTLMNVKSWRFWCSNDAPHYFKFYNDDKLIGFSFSFSEPTSTNLKPTWLVVPQTVHQAGYNKITMITKKFKQNILVGGFKPEDTLSLPLTLWTKDSNAQVLDINNLLIKPSNNINIYGPYIGLPKNNYSVIYHFADSLNNALKTNLKLDIVGNPNLKTYSEKQIEYSNKNVIDFSLEAPFTNNLEFRVKLMPDSEKNLRLNKINLLIQ